MLSPEWIQAFATVLLLVVTFIYTCHTKRLVEVSNTALLTVENLVNPSIVGCALSIINHGPGHATEVKVYVEMNCLENILEGADNPTKIVEAIGPSVLVSGKEAFFEISDSRFSMPSRTKIYVKYKVQSGKEFNYEWETDLTSINNNNVRLVKQHKKLNIVYDQIKIR